MQLLVSLIVGALIGWIASKIIGTQEGLIANMLIGVIGSALGSWLFGSVLGIGAAASAGSFSLPGLGFGVLGAAILILLLRWLGIVK